MEDEGLRHDKSAQTAEQTDERPRTGTDVIECRRDKDVNAKGA